MNTVLIVYENIPESTNMFLLEVDEKTAEKIKQCAGYYINCTEGWEEQPTEWLSEFLVNKPKIDIKKPFNVPTGTIVVHTGFVL